jgi:hypothetical protein
MNKELNEDARTKQDLLYECSSLESKLSNEIIKNEHLEQQCKKQKEVIDKLNDLLSDEFLEVIDRDTLLDILKEVSE